MGNVKHKKVSAKADGGDTTLIRPVDWNDEHVGAQEVLDRNLTQVDVANTAAETSVCTFTIPAGALGATGGLRLTIGGDALINNNTPGLIIRVKLGATTALQSEPLVPVISGNRRKFWLEILCLNSAASAQKWSARYEASIGSANFPLKHANAAEPADLGSGYSTSAEDTSGALTLNVTVQWPLATAALSFRKELALLELIPAS